jgi:hypothetical protein
MIAPTGRGRKGSVAKPPPIRARRMVRDQSRRHRHGIVSGILKLPNFRPSTAPSDCEKKFLRWPGPFGSGFLSPQPPGVVGIGPVAEEFIRYWTNASWSFFFLGTSLSGRMLEFRPDSRRSFDPGNFADRNERRSRHLEVKESFGREGRLSVTSGSRMYLDEMTPTLDRMIV